MAGFSDNEILVTTRRSGSASDPFLSLSESHKIVNNVIQLVEIPSKKDGITIVGNSITWVQTTSSNPTASQFYPDFNTGKIVFHSSREGLTNTISYVGRGFTAIGTDRVWVQKDGGTVTETLTSRLSTQATKDTSLQTQITDNETDIENKLATHKTSTDHSSDKITYSGTIPSVTDVKAAVESAYNRAGNIIASSGTSSSEVVDSRLSPDGVTHTVLKNRLDRMENKQLAAVNSPVTVKRGLNSVNAPEGGKLDVKVKGKTLTNILGNDGNGESLTPFTATGTIALSTTQKKSGSNSIKFTSTGSDGNLYKDYTYPFDTAKQYILGCWVYVESYTAGLFDMSIRDVGTFTVRYSQTASTSTIGSWQFVYVKIPTSNTLVGTGFRLYFVLGATPTAVVYLDDIRLYELSTADNTAIGTTYTATTTPSIDDFIPYVDSMKPLTTPYIEKKGKNLLPPFTDWTLHANAVATEPYKLTLTATAAGQGSTVLIDVLPSTAHTFYLNATGGSSSTIIIEYLDKNQTSLGYALYGTPTFPYTLTFTTPVNTAKLYFVFSSSASGTITFPEPMLNLGSTASTFEPQNNDYAYAISDSTGRPLAVCSNFDNTVADEINFSTGKKHKRHEYMDLDGSLTWVYHGDATGFKMIQVQLSNAVASSSTIKSHTTVKYDDKPLKVGGYSEVTTVTDTSYMDGNSLFIISISDTDTGWTDAMVPTNGEAIAYMYGYKLCDVAGAAYVSGTKYWKKITDGTGITSTLPTASYTGYTPYKLQYQLATAVEEVVTVEGVINTHSGLNQIEASEGLVIRENITPYLSGSTYYINAQDSSAYFKNKAVKIINVYKDTQPDKLWTLKTDGTANGVGYATLPSASFSSASAYAVTYLLTDKFSYTSNVVDITASVPSTQKSTLETLVQQQSDTATSLSIVQNTFARKNQGSFISPTLVNAWVNYGGSEATAQYYKDEFGLVHVKGRIKTGAIGQVAFTLPIGYRPKEPLRLAVDSNGAYGMIVINTDGTVVPTIGVNTDISINLRPFRSV